jgi:hypothetical protein
MRETLDDSIRYTALIAKNDIDAMHKLFFQQDEIHLSYRQTFGYPLEHGHAMPELDDLDLQYSAAMNEFNSRPKYIRMTTLIQP